MKPFRLSFLLLLGLLLCNGVHAAAKTNLLVLLSYHTFLPWTQAYISGLDDAQQRSGDNIQFYIEFMDSARLGDVMDDRVWLGYLREKYRNLRFDGALAESTRAAEFLHRHGEDLLGKVPMILYGGEDTHASSNIQTLESQERNAIEETLKLALIQNPTARRIIVVDGGDDESRNILKVLSPLLDQLPNQTITYLRDFTFQQLHDSIAGLDEHSILFYTLVFQDKTGEKFVPKEAVRQLAEVSRAPIYSFWSSLMDSGLVGGHMIDGRKTAAQMVTAAMDHLKDNQFKDSYDTLQTVIDWHALKRYGIKKDSIPAEATVINKPISLLETYANQIRLSITFIAVLLISTLWWLKKLTKLNGKLRQEKLRAENLARTDALTGTYNRRAFFEMSTQVCEQAKRLRLPVSVILFDIDRFKKINDTYGHLAGDEVLRATVKIINACKRDIDISARIGGEEFIILLPFSDAAGAYNLAERIRKKIEESHVDLADYRINFTLSAGIFSDTEYTNPCALKLAINQADQALYTAKRNGRNQVYICKNDQSKENPT